VESRFDANVSWNASNSKSRAPLLRRPQRARNLVAVTTALLRCDRWWRADATAVVFRRPVQARPLGARHLCDSLPPYKADPSGFSRIMSETRVP
jgi:hypothetical protein